MSERFICLPVDFVYRQRLGSREPWADTEAYLDLICQAAWKDHDANVAGCSLFLYAGEVFHTHGYLAARWNWSESKVRRFVSKHTDRHPNRHPYRQVSDSKPTPRNLHGYSVFAMPPTGKRQQTDTPSDTLTDTNHYQGYSVTGNNNKMSTQKRRLVFDDDDLKIAQAIKDHVVSVNPTAKEPNLEAWADTVRLIRQQDKRTLTQIETLLAWVSRHSFWRTNILSPSKLRDQWDRVEAQRRGQVDEERKTMENRAQQLYQPMKGFNPQAILAAERVYCNASGNHYAGNELAYQAPLASGLPGGFTIKSTGVTYAANTFRVEANHAQTQPA